MDKAVINGKTYILVPEEVYNETPERPERARTGYERVDFGEPVYSVNIHGEASRRIETQCESDEMKYTTGNYYNDEQLAKDNARADSILRRMRQWQALHDVAVDYDSLSRKWYIYYDKTKGQLKTDFNKEHILSFIVYFSSRAKAEEALEVFRDDLIWLHTEYRRRLDEGRE